MAKFFVVYIQLLVKLFDSNLRVSCLANSLSVWQQYTCDLLEKLLACLYIMHVATERVVWKIPCDYIYILHLYDPAGCVCDVLNTPTHTVIQDELYIKSSPIQHIMIQSR